jgi:hypothetical protein
VDIKRPTDEDCAEALRRFLVGLARGDDANQLSSEIADLHVRHNTFPGEVFMELAADALDVVGTTRSDAVVYPELLSHNLPEVEFRGKEHRRIQYAVLTPFAARGGLEPDLLDEVTYWIEQYWQYALFAAVAIVRECAERSGTPIEALVAELAKRSTIEIS